MINNSTALVRRLKEFFDVRIGPYAWPGVKITHLDHGADDEEAYVRVRVSLGGVVFHMTIWGNESRPPLGFVELADADKSVLEQGPCGEEVFARMAATLTAAMAAQQKELTDGR